MLDHGIRIEHGEGVVRLGSRTLKKERGEEVKQKWIMSFGTAVNEVGPTLSSG